MVTVHELSFPLYLLMRYGFDYSLGSYLAKGGMGTVYLATALDPDLMAKVSGSEIVAKVS